jgi:hypothetical protein
MSSTSARRRVTRVTPTLVTPQPVTTVSAVPLAVSSTQRSQQPWRASGIDTAYNAQAFIFSLVVATVNVVHNDLHRAVLTLPLWSLLGVATALWLLLQLLVCSVFFSHLAPLIQRRVVTSVHSLYTCAIVLVLTLQVTLLDAVVLWLGSLSIAFYFVDTIVWRDLTVHSMLGLALLGM